MTLIRYSVPYIGLEEKEIVQEAISKKRISGNGIICQNAEKTLCAKLKARKVFLVTSGTHALEAALMALGIKDGDEVICPSFAFVSTANAILRQGATPAFAEIEKATLNLNIDDVVRRITKRTKAIIPVHYAGFSCDMERLVRIASKKDIFIIEDAAQAIGAKYNKKSLGTFGELGCISFHSTKNITCGEGGAIIVNDKKFDRRIQIIREKGTNRFLYVKGKIKKYSWVDIGSSFVVSDMLAALLLAQFKKLYYITKKRRAIFKMYLDGLKGLEEKGLISIPHPDKRSYGNGHIFWILLRKGISRNRFIEKLRQKGIECTHHYVPLHSSPFGIKKLGYRKDDFPITRDVAERLVRLPLHPLLANNEISYIIRNITHIVMHREA